MSIVIKRMQHEGDDVSFEIRFGRLDIDFVRNRDVRYNKYEWYN